MAKYELPTKLLQPQIDLYNKIGEEAYIEYVFMKEINEGRNKYHANINARSLVKTIKRRINSNTYGKKYKKAQK